MAAEAVTGASGSDVLGYRDYRGIEVIGAWTWLPMYYQGLTANIMSLGGIAVAIGAMVDAAIVIIDNVHKRLHGESLEGKLVGESRTQVIIEAMQEVGPSIFLMDIS